MSSPRKSTSGRSVATAPALRAAPGPPCFLTMVRAEASGGGCWSSPSTTTIVSNPWPDCRPSASSVRLRIVQRSRVGMTTARSSGVKAEVRRPQFRRPEVLGDAGGRSNYQAVRGNGSRHDRVGAHDGAGTDARPDAALPHDRDVVLDPDRVIVVSLIQEMLCVVPEAMGGIHDQRRLAERAARPDLDRG